MNQLDPNQRSCQQVECCQEPADARPDIQATVPRRNGQRSRRLCCIVDGGVAGQVNDTRNARPINVAKLDPIHQALVGHIVRKDISQEVTGESDASIGEGRRKDAA